MKALFQPSNSSHPFEFERHAELKPCAPTVDGTILPESPFHCAASAVSAKVPLLFGSNRTEMGVGWEWPQLEDLTIRELTDSLANAYGVDRGRARPRGLTPGPSGRQAVRPFLTAEIAGRASSHVVLYDLPTCDKTRYRHVHGLRITHATAETCA